MVPVGDGGIECLHVEGPIGFQFAAADLVEVYGKAMDPSANYRNVVIFGKGNVDRSPCGTGTSAKMAALHATGKLAVGEVFVYESILGTRFKGRILEEVKVGEYDAISPEITGSAFITGFNHFVIDPDDPLAYGFSLN